MDTNSFFGKLFDFSFKEFITLQIIKYLYILGIIFAAFTSIAFLIGGFASFKYNAGTALLTILFSPVMFILLTLSARLALEALVATFRIAENTTKLVEQGERKSS